MRPGTRCWSASCGAWDSTGQRPPDADQWTRLLDRVDASYEEADHNRYLSERSTELVSAEMRVLNDRISAEKQNLQAIIASLADGILGLDPDGRVVLANPAALRLLGRTEGEVIGRPVGVVLSRMEYTGGRPVPIGTLVTRAVERGEPWAFDTGVLRTDETARNVTLAVTPTEGASVSFAAMALLRDVTADVRAEIERRQRMQLETLVADRDDQIARAEARALGLVENVADIIAVVDQDLRYRWASPSLERVLGFSGDRLPPSIEAMVHPDDIDRVVGPFVEMLDAPGSEVRFDLRIGDSRGDYRWFEAVAYNRVDDPVLDGIVIWGRDISERMTQVDLLDTQRRVLEMIGADRPLPEVLERLAEGVVGLEPTTRAAAVFVDEAGGMVASAPAGAVCSLPGPDARAWRELARTAPTDGLVPSDSPAWAAHAARFVDEGLRPVCARPVRGEDDETNGVVVWYSDLDAPDVELDRSEMPAHLVRLALRHERSRHLLHQQANFDQLTGLPNRWMLHERLTRLLAAAPRSGPGAAVLFVDLDDLKVVNDSLGHETGDEVLRAVALRLQSAVRASDVLCRFGGDEFVVVCEQLDHGSDALLVADRIIAALRRPIDLGDHRPVVTASIGIAHVGPGYEDPDALLRDADAAMYQAKARGRDQYVVFDDLMRARAVRRLDVETGLRDALEAGEITAHYQPQICLNDGRVVGLEALARWYHPERGVLDPAEWIGVAEESGLIGRVGQVVLDEACRTTRELADRLALDEPPRVSVNVAASQLTQPDLVETVVRALAASGLAPERLCLEITESSLADLTDPVGALARLKALGLRLSVDDWGTGYSSLAYLRELPVDELKVDRSFVMSLTDDGGLNLMRGICQLGRSLGLELVAEGVETASQLGHLRAFRFDLVQGFHLSHPLPADELEEFLRDHESVSGGGTDHADRALG